MASMKWNTAVLTSILNETNQLLVKAGFRLERDIKKSFGPGTGRIYMTGKNKDISHQASTPGDPPAVDTGRLRASISTNWTDSGMTRGKVDGKAEKDDGVGNPGRQQDLFRVVVGTNVEYACVSAATSVLTEKGRKRISLIKPGEKVLTQTGEFHPVLALIKRAKAEVPDMVTIKVEWRNGNRTHKITTTKDHKFLVFREGKNKWVIADELKETDLLFSRKKFEKRKGVSKFGELFCLHCYNKIKMDGNYSPERKFCSVNCRKDYWKKNNCNPHSGAKRTKESKRQMSLTRKINLEKHPENHINHILAKRGHITNEEKRVFDWLVRRGFQGIKRQVSIGGCFIDFYIPGLNIAYEADGAYWHQDQKKDIERDQKILKFNPNLKIFHIHFYNKRHSPYNIDPKPLPNVYYSVCNPDTNSYVNLSIFEAKKIISIKKWEYKNLPSGKAKGVRTAYVYDLSIENVHSYYANGVLVSNSFLEFGTSRMAARPFMRPALERIRSMITKSLKRK